MARSIDGKEIEPCGAVESTPPPAEVRIPIGAVLSDYPERGYEPIHIDDERVVSGKIQPRMIWCFDCLDARHEVLLVAKKSEAREVRAHFAHDAFTPFDTSRCRGGLETGIHEMGKEILCQRGVKLRLPDPVKGLTLSEYTKLREQVPERFVPMKSGHQRKPDVSARLANGDPIYIEVKRTCGVNSDADRVQDWLSQGHLALEIDLKDYPAADAFDMVKLSSAVLSTAPRKWIHLTGDAGSPRSCDLINAKLQSGLAQNDQGRCPMLVALFTEGWRRLWRSLRAESDIVALNTWFDLVAGEGHYLSDLSRPFSTLFTHLSVIALLPEIEKTTSMDHGQPWTILRKRYGDATRFRAASLIAMWGATLADPGNRISPRTFWELLKANFSEKPERRRRQRDLEEQENRARKKAEEKAADDAASREVDKLARETIPALYSKFPELEARLVDFSNRNVALEGVALPGYLERWGTPLFSDRRQRNMEVFGNNTFYKVIKRERRLTVLGLFADRFLRNESFSDWPELAKIIELTSRVDAERLALNRAKRSAIRKITAAPNNAGHFTPSQS